MNEYVIPEGMRLVKESCHWAWWKVFTYDFPDWSCRPIFVPLDFVKTSITTTDIDFTLPETFGVSMLMLFAIGIFGSTFTELMNNKFGYLIDPICKMASKRYAYVMERNRLRSMNGHP